MFLTKMLAKAPRISATWRMASNLRYQSTSASSSQELISVDINEKTGISIVKMNSKPVNSMTLNFLKDFCEKMDFLEKQNVKGLILTSVSDDLTNMTIVNFLFSVSEKCFLFGSRFS